MRYRRLPLPTITQTRTMSETAGVRRKKGRAILHGFGFIGRRTLPERSSNVSCFSVWGECESKDAG